MKNQYILALDQGTTGSRAFIFNINGEVCASSYQEFKQYYPKPGWVEHDADEIWSSCLNVIEESIHKAKITPQQIIGIGITNQRETTVIWDKKTSKPVSRAIVWQCRRTSTICKSQKFKELEPSIKRKTGLILDPYFSGTKIKWFLDNVSGLRNRAAAGKICFGTIDTWLIWKLTGGKNHVTDITNASRTMIYNIKNFNWDKDLLRNFNIPKQILPKVQNSGSIFGHTDISLKGLIPGIPITSVMGDQQAALYGQGCYTPGTIKNTYGTGCFIVLNTGNNFFYPKKGLITTVACDEKGNPVYAVEGSIFIAGAVVQWMRDELKILDKSNYSETAAVSVNNTNGVYFVPAFTGLGAPYWDSRARGIITGLTRGANLNHIIRAGLESIAYQTKDVFDIMKNEFYSRFAKSKKSNIKNISQNIGREKFFEIIDLKVDGGACKNDFLMQFQSDILNCKIIRPKTIESTARGTALLSGIVLGIWKGRKDLETLLETDKTFIPHMNEIQRGKLYKGWLKAVKQARI